VLPFVDRASTLKSLLFHFARKNADRETEDVNEKETQPVKI